MGRRWFLLSFLPLPLNYVFLARGAQPLGAAGRRGARLLALAGLTQAAVGQPFGPKTDYPTGSPTASAALGDVNGDGRPDTVTANNISSRGCVRNRPKNDGSQPSA